MAKAPYSSVWPTGKEVNRLNGALFNRIAEKAATCSTIFHLPYLSAERAIRCAEAAIRMPIIIISLARITKAIQEAIKCRLTIRINAAAMSSLSARGSSNFPRFVI